MSGPRVVVGLRQLLPGRIGGLETYARMLIERWAADPMGCEWILLLNEESASTFSGASARMRTIVAGSANDAVRWRRAAEALAPALYFSPLLTLDPIDTGLPSVATLPDLQHEFFPGFFSPETLAFRRLHFPLSARRAEALLTLSAHAKDTLVRHLGCPQENVHAIPLAPDDAHRARLPDAALATFRERHDLSAGYGYYPANSWPHKDHETLLRAFALLRERDGDCPALALSGFAPEAGEALAARARALGLADRVRCLGYLERSAVTAAYQAAGFLVFPSRFEGFGLPVVEAMAAGCPVICSDATCLPELAGDAALVFTAGDSDALAGALRRMIGEPGLRASLAARGLARGADFTWERTAQHTAEVLRDAWHAIGARPACELFPVPLRGDGGPDAAALAKAPAGAGLCFHNPDAPPDEALRARAARRLQESGLSALIGAATGPGEGRDAAEFDTLRLKSEDYLPLQRLWLGAESAAKVIATAAGNPGLTAYEVALIAATSGPVGEAPDLAQPGPAVAGRRVGARTGERLSRHYFGPADERWLAGVSGSALARIAPLDALLARTPRLRGAALALIGGAYRLHAGIGRGAASRAAPGAPTRGLHDDGWAGRRAELELTPSEGHQLRLTLVSPVWPLSEPPTVTLSLAGRRLYRATLTRRGEYRISLPWPAGADRRVKVTLGCNRTFVPGDHGLGADRRALSVIVARG